MISLLNKAAFSGDLIAVKTFLKYQNETHLKEKVGWTPLHYAASEDHSDICKILLENTNNKNSTSEGGKTDLCNASSERFVSRFWLYIDMHNILCMYVTTYL